MSLLAAEARGSEEADDGSTLDLPHASLLTNGYACLAQEGGLTVTINPPRGLLTLMAPSFHQHALKRIR